MEQLKINSNLDPRWPDHLGTVVSMLQGLYPQIPKADFWVISYSITIPVTPASDFPDGNC
jgi:hypothetical protein